MTHQSTWGEQDLVDLQLMRKDDLYDIQITLQQVVQLQKKQLEWLISIRGTSLVTAHARERGGVCIRESAALFLVVPASKIREWF